MLGLCLAVLHGARERYSFLRKLPFLAILLERKNIQETTGENILLDVCHAGIVVELARWPETY